MPDPFIGVHHAPIIVVFLLLFVRRNPGVDHCRLRGRLFYSPRSSALLNERGSQPTTRRLVVT
jgi:hypothetical protein